MEALETDGDGEKKHTLASETDPNKIVEEFPSRKEDAIRTNINELWSLA